MDFHHAPEVRRLEGNDSLTNGATANIIMANMASTTKNAFPAERVGCHTADYRSGCRCKTVDGSYQCHEFGERTPGIYVGRDCACQKISS